jgi:hypothetical protein
MGDPCNQSMIDGRLLEPCQYQSNGMHGELTCGSNAGVKTLDPDHIRIWGSVSYRRTYEKEGANGSKKGHAQSIR